MGIRSIYPWSYWMKKRVSAVLNTVKSLSFNKDIFGLPQIYGYK